MVARVGGPTYIHGKQDMSFSPTESEISAVTGHSDLVLRSDSPSSISPAAQSPKRYVRSGRRVRSVSNSSASFVSAGIEPASKVDGRLADGLRLPPRQSQISARKRVARQFRSNSVLSKSTLSEPAGGPVYLVVKRVIDIVGGLAGLVVLSPFMALSAVLIKLTDRGPVTYTHTRVGMNGREFTCYKFRTMVCGADAMKDEMGDMNHHEDHRTFKMRYDPRVTRVGNWLRASSFDESLQLWNVVKGEMSLVGPRPPVPGEVANYSLDDMRRLEVKPGLTCIWQVSGRSNLPFPEQLQLDIEYMERRNLWFDTKLIFKTIPAVISADGAF